MSYEDDVRSAVRRGDHAAVLRLAAAEADRAQTAGDPDGQVTGLTAMARVALDGHDPAHAEVLARTALEVAADSGEPATGARSTGHPRQGSPAARGLRPGWPRRSAEAKATTGSPAVKWITVA